MGSFIKELRSSRLVSMLAYLIIRLYTSTFRFKVENEASWKARVREGESVLLVAWHQQFFSAIRHFKTYRQHRPSLMISRSQDGDLIAGVANLTGWHTARGSSSKGGKAALEEMIDCLNETHLAAHIVDGPRGPAGRVKAGTIRLAHAAAAAIVPFYVVADRAWYFRSWDRFFVPKPFARVTLRFGERIELEPTNDTHRFEQQRLMLEGVMRHEGGYPDEAAAATG